MSQILKLLEQSPSIEEYQKLRNAVGWPSVSDQAVERSLKNSLYTVCAYIGNKMVGIGRVIGDGGIYYYIQDVIVLPQFQRRGIGRKIMTSI
ncbi:MAG: GNAT family N-acetyltransferase, partial [Candidatus Hodarchaeota archaeon]